MSDSADKPEARAPLLSGLGSVALIAGLFWYDDGTDAKYVLLAASCGLYLASAVWYYFHPDV